MKLVKKFLSIIASLSLLLSVHNLAYAEKILPQKPDVSQTSSEQEKTSLKNLDIKEDSSLTPEESKRIFLKLGYYSSICSFLDVIDRVELVFWLSNIAYMGSISVTSTAIAAGTLTATIMVRTFLNYTL